MSKQILLPQLFKMEELYLKEKNTTNVPHQVAYIIEHNFQYLKERFSAFENENKIPNVRFNRKLFEYSQLVEHFAHFERNFLTQNCSDKIILILEGSNKLIKMFCVESEKLESYQKELKDISELVANDAKESYLSKTVINKAGEPSKCKTCGKRFGSKKELKEHKQEDHSI